MDNSLFLSTIDSDKNLSSPIEIRRNIMHKLLFWDSVTLTDSQLNNNPSLRILVSGQHNDFDNLKNANRLLTSKSSKTKFPGIEDWQADFLKLMNKGLIKGAVRKNIKGEPSLVDVFKLHKQDKDFQIPNLPDIDYVKKIDKALVNFKLPYEEKNVSKLFKDKLLNGLHNLSHLSDKEICVTCNLLEIAIKENDHILFRVLLKMIDEKKDEKKINDKQYCVLYNFIFSCYSSNIPDELNLNFEVNSNFIPKYMNMGNTSAREIRCIPQDLRPSWAINPVVLDYLPSESIIEIRENMSEFFDEGLFPRLFSKNISQSDVDLMPDFWEAYTIKLESELKSSLYMKKKDIVSILDQKIPSKIESIQERELNIIKIVMSFFPIFNLGISGYETKKNLETIVMLMHEPDTKSMMVHRDLIDEFFEKGNQIITHYPPKKE